MKQLNICRCCLKIGCDKDISEEYQQDGRKEIYSDMLLDTFNIFISYEDVDGTCQICDDCIVRLRDAAEFKMQVIEAGKAIAQKLKNPIKLEDNLSEERESVLMEYVKEEEVAAEDWVAEETIDYDGFNFDFDDNNDEDAIYIINLDAKNEGSGDQDITQLAQNLLAAQLEKQREEAEAETRSNSEKPKPKMKKKKSIMAEISQTHLDKRANTLKLIRNSNMCLFKAGRGKFTCFYCHETYLTMKELREHSKTHSHTKELVIKINPVTGLAYKKAEISQLHCNRCLEPCDDLNALQDHLALIHEFTFTDSGHLLVPFKLENGLICAICKLSCNTFAYLSMHMNTHFPNYVCEVCGVAYVNFKNLDVHKRIVHGKKSGKKCKKCFEKDKCECSDLSAGLKPNKRTCVVCNVIFRYSYLLKEHNYKVHGAERPIATCDLCKKTFLTPNNLKLHVRRIHEAERNHTCKTCGMTFFTGHGMKKHIRRTHTDIEVKPYSCNYCVCKFKMKYSLSKHLKNRHGRRMDGSFCDQIAIHLETIDA